MQSTDGMMFKRSVTFKCLAFLLWKLKALLFLVGDKFGLLFYTHKFLGALQEGYHTFRGGFWNYFSMGKSSSLGVLSNILSLNLHSYLFLSRKCLLLLSRFKFHHCHLFVVIFKICILSSFFLYISQIIVDNIFLYLTVFFEMDYMFMVVGMDAQVSYAFHTERKQHPEKFKNQFSNQVHTSWRTIMIHGYRVVKSW